MRPSILLWLGLILSPSAWAVLSATDETPRPAPKSGNAMPTQGQPANRVPNEILQMSPEQRENLLKQAQSLKPLEKNH